MMCATTSNRRFGTNVTIVGKLLKSRRGYWANLFAIDFVIPFI